MNEIETLMAISLGLGLAAASGFRVFIPQASKRISSNPNIIFSITTHKNTNYDDYILVLDQLKQANASKISIANPPSF